jgi:hypothetical protein
VAVYKASLDTAPANGRMPDGCRLLAQKPPVDMTELEIEGQKDPYRVFRNEAGAAGANALLARSRVIVSRRNFECPSASRITDCPGSSGAWLRVVFETYACTPEALRDLDARRDAAGAHP